VAELKMNIGSIYGQLTAKEKAIILHALKQDEAYFQAEPDAKDQYHHGLLPFYDRERVIRKLKEYYYVGNACMYNWDWPCRSALLKLGVVVPLKGLGGPVDPGTGV